MPTKPLIYQILLKQKNTNLKAIINILYQDLFNINSITLLLNYLTMEFSMTNDLELIDLYTKKLIHIEAYTTSKFKILINIFAKKIKK